jgi:hypothetical protein
MASCIAFLDYYYLVGGHMMDATRPGTTDRYIMNKIHRIAIDTLHIEWAAGRVLHVDGNATHTVNGHPHNGAEVISSCQAHADALVQRVGDAILTWFDSVGLSAPLPAYAGTVVAMLRSMRKADSDWTFETHTQYGGDRLVIVTPSLIRRDALAIYQKLLGRLATKAAKEEAALRATPYHTWFPALIEEPVDVDEAPTVWLPCTIEELVDESVPEKVEEKAQEKVEQKAQEKVAVEAETSVEEADPPVAEEADEEAAATPVEEVVETSVEEADEIPVEVAVEIPVVTTTKAGKKLRLLAAFAVVALAVVALGVFAKVVTA